MRRIAGIATALLLAPLATLGVLSGAAEAATTGTATSHAAAATPCTGTNTIEITQLAFSPASVTPGQTSMLNLTAVNCTSQSVTTSLTSYGQFQSPSTPNGVPPGCPVIDPLWQPVTFSPGGTYATSISFPVFTGCTATSLQGIVRFNGSAGGTLAQGTALLTITQSAPPAACHVTYTPQGQWAGGFTAAISISNTGTTPDRAWTLTFAFGGDQKITSAWNAAFQQTGNTVSLTSLPYNGAIAPGGTVTGIGFQGTWSASSAVPSNFAVNGSACS